MNWRTRALCAEVGSEPFFPNGDGDAKYDTARDICAACPVQVQCLQEALVPLPGFSYGAFGMWAGTTPTERRKMFWTSRSEGSRLRRMEETR